MANILIDIVFYLMPYQNKSPISLSGLDTCNRLSKVMFFFLFYLRQKQEKGQGLVEYTLFLVHCSDSLCRILSSLLNLLQCVLLPFLDTTGGKLVLP